MAETTHYGSWSLIVRGDERGPRARLETYLADLEPSDALLDELTTDYRRQINALLPTGVTCAGDLFYGPVADHEGIKVICGIIREAVESIDLLEFIVACNEGDDGESND